MPPGSRAVLDEILTLQARVLLFGTRNGYTERAAVEWRMTAGTVVVVRSGSTLLNNFRWTSEELGKGLAELAVKGLVVWNTVRAESGFVVAKGDAAFAIDPMRFQGVPTIADVCRGPGAVAGNLGCHLCFLLERMGSWLDDLEVYLNWMKIRGRLVVTLEHA